MRVRAIWSAIAVIAFGAAVTSRADVVVFSDNFNVSAGTGSTNTANFQINSPGRQSGVTAPLPYVEVPSGADAHHQVFPIAPHANFGQPLMVSADSAVNGTSLSPNANFALAAAGNRNFTLGFDIDPNDPRDSTAAANSWIGISFGAASTGVGITDATNHFGVLFRGNGRYQTFDGATNVTVGGGDGDVVTAGGGQYTHITASITDADGNPFDGVGSVLVALSSDTTGVFAIYSRPDFSGNAITIQSHSEDGNVSVSYIDNIALSTTPEPSAATILLAGGAGLSLRRRNR